MDQNYVVTSTGSCSGSGSSSCESDEVWPTSRGFHIMWGMLACIAFLNFAVAIMLFFFPRRVIPEFSAVPLPAQPLISSSYWENPFKRHTAKRGPTLPPSFEEGTLMELILCPK
ncbi:hypothetical protein Pelo_19886 [Pelomyxa schiedti]|nr:hypothetical protein Pelo_19886 [Pelomyxa schiedti]